jgi:hypothetical protein
MCGGIYRYIYIYRVLARLFFFFLRCYVLQLREGLWLTLSVMYIGYAKKTWVFE